MSTQTFEEAIQEFLERSREMLGEETTESLPPGSPSPYRQDGPPYECAIRLDARTIRNYVRTIGEDNPLYTDPAYAKSSKYGCLTIPGPFLSMVRGITAHGAQSGEAGKERPGGYPVANFFSGTAWEFFDVLRIGSKFSSSMVTKELIEKPGSRGNLLFFISELLFWDDHGDLPAKCSGTLIMVPIETMGHVAHHARRAAWRKAALRPQRLQLLPGGYPALDGRSGEREAPRFRYSLLGRRGDRREARPNDYPALDPAGLRRTPRSRRDRPRLGGRPRR